MKQHQALLSEICYIYNLTFEGEDVLIDSLNLSNRDSMYSNILSYTTNADFSDVIANNKSVKAIIVPTELFDGIKHYMDSVCRKISYIVAENTEHTFYSLHNLLYWNTCFYDKFEQNAIVGKNCDIDSSVVIESGVIIGDNVTIGPNSVIRKGTIIDDDVTIGCCSVIGSEGFQAIKDFRQKIKHVGKCHICRGANIGDNTTICNSLFEGETIIGEYTNIDNHCQIAHNCIVGKNCVITSTCTMMGTTELGDNVWLAPNSVVLNKMKVGDGSFVGTFTFVNRNLKPGSAVFGIPAKKILL